MNAPLRSRQPLPRRLAPWFDRSRLPAGRLADEIPVYVALVEYGRRRDNPVRQGAIRLAASLAGVAALTWSARVVIPVNAPTAGFGYLLLILVIASAWSFREALVASLASTLAFNYFFFPPIGTLTIQDPENWVALLSFLATSVIASRLSSIARRRALDAVNRQQDLERLYAFSRGILSMGSSEPFPAQIVRKMAETFELSSVTLYERESEEFHRFGNGEDERADARLRQAAETGIVTAASDPARQMTPVRLGSDTIAALTVEGRHLPEPVLQGVANLVAIGLERAKAQDMAHEIEAARRSEQLRTTLIDAMAHEFKTPLTSIKAATTSLLSDPAQPEPARLELLRIADDEADRLRRLIDNAIDMARLDTARIDVALERSRFGDIVEDVIASMQSEIDERSVEVIPDPSAPSAKFDPRLLRLATKQLVDNALKYSAPESPIRIRVGHGNDSITLDVTNRGGVIPLNEQPKLFERFYRSRTVKHQTPGAGLGLSIAKRIAQAHRGDVTVTSGRGETTFRITLPLGGPEGEA